MMPTEAEALAGYLAWQLAVNIDEVAQRYRDDPEFARLFRADLIRFEDAYRRLGDFVHLIRPQRDAA